MRGRAILGEFTVLSVLSVLLPPYSIVLFAVGALCSAVVVRRLWNRPRDERRVLAVIVLVALLIRFVAIVAIPAIMNARFGIPFTTGSDPVGFHETASAYMMDRPDGWKPLRPGRSFMAILVTLYRAFGANPLWPRLLNLVATVPLVTFGYDLARNTFDRETATVTGIGLALFPSLILLTVRLGDDVLAITGSIAALYYLARIEDRPRLAGMAFIGTTLIVLYLRNQTAYLLIAVATAYAAVRLYQEGKIRNEISLGKALGIGSLIAGSGVLLVLLLGGDSLFSLLRYWSGNNMNPGDTGLANTLRAASLPLRLMFGPIALFLMPYPPWEVLLDMRQAPAYFFAASSAVLYLTAPYLLYGMASAISSRRPERLIPLFFVGLSIVGIASVYGGTVPRFRTTVEPFAIMFIVAGLYRLRRIGIPYAVYTFCFVGFTLLYYRLFG